MRYVYCMNTLSEPYGLLHNLRQDMKQVAPSFCDALHRKDYKALAVKSTGTVMGSLLTAQGVYQFSKGAQEQVENPERPNEKQTNYTRMFLGAMTTFFGASMLYLAATSHLRLAR